MPNKSVKSQETIGDHKADLTHALSTQTRKKLHKRLQGIQLNYAWLTFEDKRPFVDTAISTNYVYILCGVLSKAPKSQKK